MKKKIARGRGGLTTTEGVLRIIRKFLKNSQVPFEERDKLVILLTALRGPDVEFTSDMTSTPSVKEATTGVVRSEVLGKEISCRYGLVCALDGPDDPVYEAIRASLPPGHFTNHVELAFKVLGLKWPGGGAAEKRSRS